MRLSKWGLKKSIMTASCFVLSAIMMLSIMGISQDTQDLLKTIRRYGTEYTFRARILDMADDKNSMIVQKEPATTVVEKRICVLITRETQIGYWAYEPSPNWKVLSYKALKEEGHVLIHGLKMIEKGTDQDIMFVEAKRIEPTE
jgi:hypothetical protein